MADYRGLSVRIATHGRPDPPRPEPLLTVRARPRMPTEPSAMESFKLAELCVMDIFGLGIVRSVDPLR